MCINMALEKENWDATNSWSGYNYQGKIALFVVLQKINDLICEGKINEIENYSVELEWLEDFSILCRDNDGIQYRTIHQVKAKDKQNINDYGDALVKLYYKVTRWGSIETAYLHVCKPTDYKDIEWHDKVKGLIINCNQLKSIQNSFINYKNSSNKKEEVEKIYKPGRKSDINKIVKEYNEKYFFNKKITVNNVDEILDKILSGLQDEITVCENEIKDEDVKKIEMFSYPNHNLYCGLDEIDNLIKEQIVEYWKNSGIEGWKCADQNFCNMIFLCLQGLIDRHITQRHIQYNKTDKRSIEFTCIKKVLDSDDSIARCEEYYLYKIKEKLLVLCKEYHDFCSDEWDTDEEREFHCKRCEVHSFYEKVSQIPEDKIRDFIHAINPNILKKIDEMNWGDYCNADRYNNPFFKGLRDIDVFYEKDKDYISYVGKDKKMNLLTTVGNREESKRALMRVCGAIVINPDLYEILMDYDCLISKDLEINSIYEGAGDYLKDFKIENNHIYHCKNLKMTSLERAIANLMEE